MVVKWKHPACLTGAVCITSLNPKFNGSHFGLSPSSVHRMTGWVVISRILWRMRTAPIWLFSRMLCISVAVLVFRLISFLLIGWWNVWYAGHGRWCDELTFWWADACDTGNQRGVQRSRRFGVDQRGMTKGRKGRGCWWGGVSEQWGGRVRCRDEQNGGIWKVIFTKSAFDQVIKFLTHGHWPINTNADINNVTDIPLRKPKRVNCRET